MWLISKKITVEDSGLMEGFRDCHCHVLPGVDDGVKELNTSLEILKRWESMGVKEVWMTPHVMEDIPNEPEALRTRFNKTTAVYNGELELHLAAENMLDGLFTKRLEDNVLLPIGEEGTRLLVETSYYIPPINMEELIDKVKAKGYTPILAHPERYQYMEVRDYKHWKEKGVMLQLNVPSLVMAYGPDVMRKAEWLLDHDMYDYCGTDTHSMNQVEYFMKSTINKKTVRKVRTLAEQQEL